MGYDGYRSASFHYPPEEREKILAILREFLAGRQDVLFAYVYGSFGTNLPFHDIDVGVYLTEERAQENVWMDVELAMRLEQAVSRQIGRVPVDVRVLNRSPLPFRYHVLRGRLLFSRNESVRVPWVARTVARYLDVKPLRQAAVKEAITSWA